MSLEKLASEGRWQVELPATALNFRPTAEDAIFVVMGATGVGKSRFIANVIGDTSIRLGHTLAAATEKLEVYRTWINGTPVVLVDTPGFDDVNRSDAEVLQEVAWFLADSYAAQGSMRRNMLMLRQLVGQDAYSKVTIITTMWDEVALAFAEPRERELFTNDEFWGAMVAKGSSMLRSSGKREEALIILKNALRRDQSRSERAVLKVQEELVDRGLSLSETGAGREVMEEINKKRRAQLRTIETTQDAMNALKSDDPEREKTIALLKDELKRSWDEAKALQDQTAELKLRYSVLEDLQQTQHDEMRSMKESFEQRINLLEKHISAPPAADFDAQGQISGVPQADQADQSDVSQTEQEDQANQSTQADQNNISMGSINSGASPVSLWELVQRLVRPRVPVGSRRLEWRCVCGDLLYGDFKESIPGSLNVLAAALNSHSSSVSSGGSTPSSSSAARTSQRHAPQQVGWNLPGGSPRNSSGPASSAGPSTSNAHPRQALQLCIETSRYTLELAKLGLHQPSSDGVLFERIRRQYEHTRHSPLPLRLRFSKPDKAIFVKFRVGKVPFVSPIAGSLDMPSIPPEAEVKAGNYKYIPCPIDEPPMDSRTFLHYFYSPAHKHPDGMWSSRLPWYLGADLGPMGQGWGVHLEEHADWPLFAALMFFALLLSGLVAGIYSWKMEDSQTGVAIGAWLTGVQAMGVTAVFFWWV